ncbi:MAG: hypothetical protein ACN4GR_09530 [Arenicellales bacterium]
MIPIVHDAASRHVNPPGTTRVTDFTWTKFCHKSIFTRDQLLGLPFAGNGSAATIES